MNIRNAALASAAAVAALAGAGLAAAPAHAALSTTTLVTRITDRPDSGNGGTWAYDNLDRTLTVTVNPNQAGVPAGFTGYTATVSDTGSFTAIQSNDTPNQSTAGLTISHPVKGSVSGGVSYTVTAPDTDSLVAQAAPASEDDHFNSPSGEDTTGLWPEQAFESTAGVTVTMGTDWSWTYQTGCQTWIDSQADGDGNTPADGNITGKVCPVPVLYDGSAVYVAPTRETVDFKQTVASVDKFTIVGPGAINGHVGWVNAAAGGAVNSAVYSGLEAKHGYTVLYTPYTAVNGHQVKGTTTGYVYFVSDTPAA